MSDSKAWWVKCENIIREGCVPVGETGWERVYLVSDYDASEARVKELEAELATLTDWTNKRGPWYTAELDSIKADLDRLAAAVTQHSAAATAWARDHQLAADERDKLAATVERVKALFGTGSYTFSREQLDRALRRKAGA